MLDEDYVAKVIEVELPHLTGSEFVVVCKCPKCQNLFASPGKRVVGKQKKSEQKGQLFHVEYVGQNEVRLTPIEE